MWPHQSSLREILRCVCYEKMEGSRASCVASRGAFGFLCSPRLANFQERGALALDACHHFPNQPSTAPTSGPQLRVPGRGSPSSHLFWGRRAQMCRVTARFPEMTRPRRPRSPGAGSVPGRPADVLLLPAGPGCLNNMWEVISHNFLCTWQACVRPLGRN